MFRKIFTIGSLILVGIITSIFAISAIVAIFFSGKKIFFPLSIYWAKLVLFVSGIKVDIINHDKLSDEKSYIYIPNHSSLYDIPVLLSTIQGNTRIMYKEELENIPIFGWCLKMSPFISVKREDKENSLEGFKQALDAVNSTDSVIIFPEGTRSEDGNLGEFKKGAFLLAIKSGKEIVPVVIKGTNKLMSKGSLSLSRGNVSIEYNKIINPKDNPDINTKNLMEHIRAIMMEKLSK